MKKKLAKTTAIIIAVIAAIWISYIWLSDGEDTPQTEVMEETGTGQLGDPQSLDTIPPPKGD